MNFLLTKICIFTSLFTLGLAGIDLYSGTPSTALEYFMLALSNCIGWIFVSIMEEE